MANNVDEINKSCGNYLDTVHALLCFISLVCWERTPEPYFSFGRRMHTSPQNRIKKEEEVTPDAVIQLTNNLGLIIETKVSLPENASFWRKEADQIIKYDDNLKGWWTTDEYITDYNVVVLIEITKSLKFKSYLLELQANGEITLGDVICGISFVRTQRLTEQIYFQPLWGRTKDSVLSSKLENGMPIPLEKVKVSYGNIKFYDHEPDVEHLVVVMWNDVFITKKDPSNFDPETKRHLISVEVNALAHELQRSFGCIAIRRTPADTQHEQHREVEFPKISWVRRALDFLTTIGYAKRRSENEYTVLYRLIRKDLIEYFASKRIKEKKRKPEEKEPTLFDES